MNLKIIQKNKSSIVWFRFGRKNKNELTPEDYENFYAENVTDLTSHLNICILMSMEQFDIMRFYLSLKKLHLIIIQRNLKKGLELYSNGVLIMDKCADLLPDYFSFVKGMVDSEDLSLNISREILQHDRQLKLIAKNISKKIKSELQSLLKNEREKYEDFYQSFGRQLKYGVYSDYGMHKEELQDLIMFYSSKEKKLVTLDEYVSSMPEDQKYIYYAIWRIERKN